jgi:hypothetical protein
MKALIAFLRAYAFAYANGLAVSFDYGDFSSPDWDFITVTPKVTKFTATKEGITINGEFIPWAICSSFSCCPIIAENHTGVSVKTYHHN